MGKDKKKPVRRKSNIKIIAQKKGPVDQDSVQCEYCGGSMAAEAIYCSQCGQVRRAEI